METVTDDQWAAARKFFYELCDLPLEQRDARLALISDLDVRREVDSLLRHADPGTLSSVLDAVVDEARLFAASSPTDRLGPYRLGRRIGRGGQGTVFEASRDDRAFEKLVAIKILHQAADHPEARARFAQERHILAALEHPHIGRLLDGGDTESGLSYVVLEFVDGQNILDYAAAHNLSESDRLHLFLKICDAVHYAHQNLVVHRDLKPGNILVAANGTPKLLDFGIAKMLSGDVTRTITGLHSFTPRYASPEQVRGLSITTASDIYSLGAVLYELLTGRHPYPIPSGSPGEIEHAICTTHPDPPRVSSDLDNILLMALRKEPDRRYSSVDQFAADIRRHLSGLPVLAHGESWSYAASKFLLRNRLAVCAAAILLLLATAGFAYTYREKQRAQRRFADVQQLASSFLFDIEGQLHDLPGATKAREMVVSSALTYLNRLAPDAAGDHALLQEIALAYEKTAIVQGWPSAPNLGHLREALDTFAKAIAIWEKLVAAHPADPNPALHLSVCLSETADIQRRLRLYREGETSSIRAGEFAGRALARQPGDLDNIRAAAQALRGRGLAILGQGDAAAAVPLLRQAVDSIARYTGPKSQVASFEYANQLSNLAVALERRGELEEALHAVERCLQIYETDLVGWKGRSGLERNRINVYQTKGNLLGAPDRPNLGHPDQAMLAYQRARDLAEAAFRADPNSDLARQDFALNIGKIANLLTETDPARSIQFSDQALAILRQGSSIDETNLDLGYYLSIAQPLRILGRTRESLDRLQDAFAILQRMQKAAPNDPFIQTSLANVYQSTGQTLRSAGQANAATENFRRALAIVEPIAQAHPEDLNLQCQLAGIYDDLGLREKSQTLWRNWLKLSPNSEYARSQLRTCGTGASACPPAH